MEDGLKFVIIHKSVKVNSCGKELGVVNHVISMEVDLIYHFPNFITIELNASALKNGV